MKTPSHIEDKWLGKLKSKMSDYEMAAPDGLWESIQDEMSTGHKAGIFRTALSRLRMSLIAAAVMLLLGITVYFSIVFLDNKSLNLTAYTGSETKQEHTPNYKTSASDNPDSPTTTAYNHLATTKSKASSYKHNAGGNVSITSKQTISYSDTVPDPQVDFDGEDNVVSTGSDDKSSSEDNAAKIEEAKKMSLWAHDNTFTPQYSTERNVMSKRGSVSDRVSIGVITSAGIYSLSESSNRVTSYFVSTYTDFSNSTNGSDPGSNDNNGSNSGGDINPVDPGPWTEGDDGEDKGNDDDNGDDSKNREIRTKSADEPDLDEFSHRPPIRLGVTFMYSLSKRIGLETGIVYTNLYSDIRYGGDSGNYFREAEQSLHYIGIPLNVKYSPFSWERLDLYLSGGVLVEKCVAADIKDDSGQGALGSKAYYYDGIDERPFQFSVNASAGVQFKFSDIIGIYAEPGVSYFFNDNSRLRTIYSDKPCSFSFTVGLRISFK